jgi:hypothetical protein
MAFHPIRCWVGGSISLKKLCNILLGGFDMIKLDCVGFTDAPFLNNWGYEDGVQTVWFRVYDGVIRKMYQFTPVTRVVNPDKDFSYVRLIRTI